MSSPIENTTHHPQNPHINPQNTSYKDSLKERALKIAQLISKIAFFSSAALFVASLLSVGLSGIVFGASGSPLAVKIGVIATKVLLAAEPATAFSAFSWVILSFIQKNKV